MIRKDQYRDKEKARKTCNAQRKRNYAQTAHARRENQRWTDVEIKLAMEHVITDRELSKLIGRSVQSIQVKRSRMLNVEV